MSVSGLENVLANLAKAVKELDANATKGLIKAGVLVRSEGQRETPVDTANLINSWYGPELFRTFTGPIVEIGLTANYAPYVHEMVGANFQKPGAKAKFVEDPLKRNERRILEIIAQEAKIR